MTTIAITEYNKICKELDEVKGDLIEVQHANARLRREYNNYLVTHRPPANCSWIAYTLSFTLVVSLILNYIQYQKLLWWQCPPSYQTPSSPTLL